MVFRHHPVVLQILCRCWQYCETGFRRVQPQERFHDPAEYAQLLLIENLSGGSLYDKNYLIDLIVEWVTHQIHKTLRDWWFGDGHASLESLAKRAESQLDIQRRLPQHKETMNEEPPKHCGSANNINTKNVSDECRKKLTATRKPTEAELIIVEKKPASMRTPTLTRFVVIWAHLKRGIMMKCDIMAAFERIFLSWWNNVNERTSILLCVHKSRTKHFEVSPDNKSSKMCYDL